MGGLDLRTLHSHLSGNEQGISVLRFTQLHSLAMPGVQTFNSQPDADSQVLGIVCDPNPHICS